MSSMSNVAGLSKYITTLPKIKTTIILIIMVSFISGCINFTIDPFFKTNLLKNIIYGGICGIILLGISSIISGIINQYLINLFKGINYKIKHSMFLSFLSMLFISILLIIISNIEYFLKINLLTNTLLFGCIIILGINTLLIHFSSNLNFKKSLIISITQPLIIILSYILLFSLLTKYPITKQIIQLFINFLFSSILFIAIIYIYKLIIEAPMKKNLGINVYKIISFFLAEINSGSTLIEELFDKMGTTIDTIVNIISFKNKNGIKCLFISPCIHPGPLGNVGGANMPTLLANKFNCFTMVAHGPSTHDFNPVSVNEIDKLYNIINNELSTINYDTKASKFKRYENGKSKLGVQFFNKGMVLLSTFAPEGSDDIEFGVGLTMMIHSKNICKVENSVIVDCHNSFTPESGGVLSGNHEVFQIIDLINTIENDKIYEKIRIGTYSNTMEKLNKNEGVGESGLKILICEVDNQKTAYILFDSNNMEIGFREEIIDACKELDIDEIEIMTTDTHSVNTIARGYNPIGLSKRNEIINYVKEGINIAINDLEEVTVGTKTKRITNLKTLGPQTSTELISTISSIVSIAKIVSPLLFITSILIIFVIMFNLI